MGGYGVTRCHMGERGRRVMGFPEAGRRGDNRSYRAPFLCLVQSGVPACGMASPPLWADHLTSTNLIYKTLSAVLRDVSPEQFQIR